MESMDAFEQNLQYEKEQKNRRENGQKTFFFVGIILFIIFILFVILFGEAYINSISEPSIFSKSDRLLQYENISSELPRFHFQWASNQVITPFQYLSTATMTIFTDIVNKTMPHFLMITPDCVINKSHIYSLFPVENRDDVQILFIRWENTNIGHFITIFYNSFKKIIQIYDSSVSSYTSIEKEYIERHICTILKELYPNPNNILEWKVPKSQQEDKISCGVYAIAYCLLILYGKDPEHFELDLDYSKKDPTMSLRKPISDILKQGRI